MTVQIVQDEAADEVLSTSAFALLCGMLLHEQVDVDVAFAGPAKILDRFGSLDPTTIADAPPEEFAELCAAEPVIHPYPESMAVLIQAVASYVVVNYGGDTASMWATAGSGEHLLSRLMLMPGFNQRKAQMFMALLGKQLGVRPDGWEQAAGPYGEAGSFRSAADVRDPESLDKVRSAKPTRNRGSDKTKDKNKKGGRSAHNKESRGLTHVNTDDERETETADQGDGDRAGQRGGGKQAAAKASRRAANEERRRAKDIADPAGAEKRAAKRAERQEARASGGASKGKGQGKGGRNKGGGGSGGGGRNRPDAAPAPVDSSTGDESSAE